MVLFSLITLFLALTIRVSLSQTTSSSSTLAVSSDGTCGTATNSTCLNSIYGDCCSARGFCGSTNDFCNPTAGCQPRFGSCSTNTSFISYDGRCGTKDPNKQVCVGSTYGSCCSQNGWCGSTTDYCGIGCQSAFGTCGGTNVTVTNPTPSPVSSNAGSENPSSPRTAGAIGLKTSLILEIAGAVLGVVLVVIAVIMFWLIMKRRTKASNAVMPVSKSMPEPDKEVGIVTKDGSYGKTLVYEAPGPYGQSIIPSTSTHADPVEISNGSSRAELRERHSQLYEA